LLVPLTFDFGIVTACLVRLGRLPLDARIYYPRRLLSCRSSSTARCCCSPTFKPYVPIRSSMTYWSERVAYLSAMGGVAAAFRDRAGDPSAWQFIDENVFYRPAPGGSRLTQSLDAPPRWGCAFGLQHRRLRGLDRAAARVGRAARLLPDSPLSYADCLLQPSTVCVGVIVRGGGGLLPSLEISSAPHRRITLRCRRAWPIASPFSRLSG